MDTVEEGRESLELDLPIQRHSRPPTPRVIPPPDEGRRTPRHRNSEDSDERMLQQAQELGIQIPPEPKASSLLDMGDENASTITMSSGAQDTHTLQSRNSQSTRPTSFNSSDRDIVYRSRSDAVSPPPVSIRSPRSRSAAPSFVSTFSGSGERPYSRLRKSIRRLSTFTKRLSTVNSPPSLLSDSGYFTASLRTRPSTAQSFTRGDDDGGDGSSSSLGNGGPTTHMMSAMVLPSLSESRLSAIYPPSRLRYDEDEQRERRLWAARERSVRCGRLQRLRIHQLDQQSEFLRFHFEAIDQVRARYSDERREAAAALKERQEEARARHAERNADLETRHLAAELDLTESLEAERRACETKLKYMDAYCNGRVSLTPNGPPRKVTEEDFRKLVEQYNVRNGLAALHESRINVLREKQAKQLERVVARQDAELQAAQDQADAEAERKEEARRAEEAELRREFEFKKDKIVWRWKVMEAVERRRLELERGVEHGELPEVQWPEDMEVSAAL